MGHQKLGTLPRSRRWHQIVELLGGGADVTEIAAATALAAESSLADVSNDAVVRHAFWLLTQIPQAARDMDFVGALGALHLDAPIDPSLADVVAAAVDATEQERPLKGRGSDYGEMARLALAESLYAIASRQPDLLGETPDRVRTALAGLASPRQFAVLARDFFARLTQRHLDYFLSRELVHHAGIGRRFPTLRQLEEFQAAIDTHCREATRVIRDFSAEWFSKHTFEGGIDREKAGRFVSVAASKIRDELKRRRPADG